MEILKKALESFMVLLLLSGCDNRHFVYEVKEVDYLNKSNTILKGEKVGVDNIGMDEVMICDSFLIISTLDPSGFLTVYEIPSLEKKAQICKRGKARNEFSNPAMIKQSYYSGDDLIIPIIDNLSFVKEVNLTKSLDKNNAEVKNVNECLSLVDGNFIILNNDIDDRFEYVGVSMSKDMKDSYLTPHYYFSKNDTKKEIKVFPNMMEFEDEKRALAFYCGYMFKKSNQNIIIQPFEYMDYILFFNLETNHYFAVHQIGSLSFDDKIPPKTGETILKFTDCAISNDFFLVLYFAGDYSLGFEDYLYACPELLMFDWDGNFLNSAKLSEMVHSISFDKTTNTLYGIDRNNDCLYSFDLNSFVK